MYDVIIVGAGASGLMAAMHAAQRGRKTLIIDHAKRVGQKLLVSGGGKCNITNQHIAVSDYFGVNCAFCEYALTHYTTDFTLDMLRRMNIQTEEREHGRIFCRKSAEEVVLYLVRALEEADVHFSLNTVVSDVKYAERFCIESTNRKYESSRLLLATGGLAWPQIGATGIGYTIARQFGHTIAPLRPALVGLTLPPNSPLLNLQGISLDVNLQIKGKSPVIAEPLLFTHKGISGPSVLQISCFWTKGDHITVNFLPSDNVIRQMHDPNNGKLLVKNLLMRSLPERLVRALIPEQLMERKVAEVGKKDRQTLAECVHSYMVLPFDVEGFSKAEATLGGVCTDEIYPQSMESRLVKGLFFSGEVIDITGKLGGYNIHWAFASGYVAGQNI